MLHSLSSPSVADLPLQASVKEMSPGTVPLLGLALVAIGSWLLWRAAQPSRPSRTEERRGGIVFVVLGAVVGVAGLIGLYLD
ncbi:hypothetical protein [Catellatospora sichuanensis]|uniref:hypothetical protein n=1 Tax=Catellatospora sichuanensis TaxID=1969805 RepID=UPI00118274A9|nr:hypothetical protein [Catellatospora sichuanensis]